MNKFTKPIGEWVRDNDSLVESSATQLHFQSDSKQKTQLGGLCSIGVSLYVLFMVYSNGRKMIERDNNSYVSLQE
jgi:hypothetical protein